MALGFSVGLASLPEQWTRVVAKRASLLFSFRAVLPDGKGSRGKCVTQEQQPVDGAGLGLGEETRKILWGKIENGAYNPLDFKLTMNSLSLLPSKR